MAAKHLRRQSRPYGAGNARPERRAKCYVYGMTAAKDIIAGDNGGSTQSAPGRKNRWSSIHIMQYFGRLSCPHQNSVIMQASAARRPAIVMRKFPTCSARAPSTGRGVDINKNDQPELWRWPVALTKSPTAHDNACHHFGMHISCFQSHR